MSACELPSLLSFFAIASAEQTQEVGDKKNQQNRPETDASSTSNAPTAVAIVPATTAEEQNQNNDQYQHADLPFFSLTLAVERT
jgi:hypothetical protein